MYILTKKRNLANYETKKYMKLDKTSVFNFQIKLSNYLIRENITFLISYKFDFATLL